MGENAARALTVRKWNGSAFGAPIGVGAGNEAPQAHISQDPAGVLHLVWPTIDANGFNLHYATSSRRRGLLPERDRQPERQRGEPRRACRRRPITSGWPCG